MIGAIVGDIVGSRFEFNNTHSKDFTLFTDECNFTDDTICTVSIAYALAYGVTYEQSLRSMCALYPTPMGGYGAKFNQWIWSEDPQPYNSYGNGSAMRVSPVAWWFDTLEDVKREAERSAICTHNHPEGVKGAVAVAHAIFFLRTGGTLEGLPDVVREYYPDFDEKASLVPSLAFDETCQHNVPLAFQIVLRSRDFIDAIKTAVAQGGDSDTLAAIVGSIAEAVWPIPEYITEIALAYLPGLLDQAVGKYFERLTEKNEQQYGD